RVSRAGTNEYCKAGVYRELNRQRRLRRMRRVVIRSAEAARGSFEWSRVRYDALMATFTYRPGVLWRPEHIRECVRRVKQWCDRRGVAVRYQWVIELTRAGVPHYHLL